MKNAWIEGEPGLFDESEFTKHGETGWHAWNVMSPELEFCHAVADLVNIIKPLSVLETGVGQGFTTRRVLEVLPEDAIFLGFESDDSFRSKIPSAFVTDLRTPEANHFYWAKMSLLDSDPPWRFDEIKRWGEKAQDGAFIVVHDTGNGHAETTLHHRIWKAVEALEIPGVRFANPRGSFFGWKGDTPDRIQDMMSVLPVLETVLL